MGSILGAILLLALAGVIAGGIVAQKRRPRAVWVATLVGLIAAWTVRDVPAALLVPATAGAVLLAALANWRERPSLAMPLLPWSLVLADDAFISVPLAWIAAGVSTERSRRALEGPTSDRLAPHPLLRFALVFGAMLLWVDLRVSLDSIPLARIAIGWAGLVMLLDVLPDGLPQTRSLVDRVGSLLLGGQTLLAMQVAAGELPAPANLWIVSLAALAVGGWLLALQSSANATTLEHLYDATLASAASLLIVAIAARSLVPTPLPMSIADATLLDGLLLAASLTPFALLLLAARLDPPGQPTTRRGVALIAATLPVLPTGGLWWAALPMMLAQPIVSPLTRIPEPLPAGMLLCGLVLAGPLVLVPGVLALWPDGDRVFTDPRSASPE